MPMGLDPNSNAAETGFVIGFEIDHESCFELISKVLSPTGQEGTPLVVPRCPIGFVVSSLFGIAFPAMPGCLPCPRTGRPPTTALGRHCQELWSSVGQPS